MADELTLDIDTDTPPAETLIVAFPGPGLAGVSANQYLIEQLGLEETGHIQAAGLPAITPYVHGRPYHHTRLFSTESFGYTVLISELPIPLQLSEPFGRILLEWIDDSVVDEVVLLTAIPTLESTADLYYIASDDYRERRLDDTSIQPMEGGYLTGVNASLTAQAIDTSLRVGVLASSVNPWQAMDGAASLRLVEGLNSIYGLDVDTTELRAFAERTRQHYEQLAAEIQAQQESLHRRVAPEDYGYM